MIELKDTITIVQIVLITILAIICLTECINLLLYNHAEDIVIMRGGDNIKPTDKSKINTIKQAWNTLKILRKPIQYYTSSVNIEYNNSINNMVKVICNTDIEPSHIMYIARVFGASNITTFIKGVLEMYKNIDKLDKDFTTFVQTGIPKLMELISGDSPEIFKKLVLDNMSDIKTIFKTAIDNKWIQNDKAVEHIKNFLADPDNTISIDYLINSL